MKRLLTLLFLSTTTVFAQSILKGRVVAKNGSPIYLANVYIEGAYDGSTTDSLGNFTFETKEKAKNTFLFSAYYKDKVIYIFSL